MRASGNGVSQRHRFLFGRRIVVVGRGQTPLYQLLVARSDQMKLVIHGREVKQAKAQAFVDAMKSLLDLRTESGEHEHGG